MVSAARVALVGGAVMGWQLVSVFVIVSAPLVIGVYDLAAYLVSGNEATISKVSLDTARTHPSFQWSVCFLFGVLCAHLFAPTRATEQFPAWFSLTLIVGVPLVTAFGALLINAHEHRLMGVVGRDYPMVSVMIYLVLGVLIGGAYLPQSAE